MSYWYENTSPENRAYRAKLALDRDSRLNPEEQAVYDYTEAELLYGRNFFKRAHP